MPAPAGEASPAFNNLLQQADRINTFFTRFADLSAQWEGDKTAAALQLHPDELFRQVLQQWQQPDMSSPVAVGDTACFNPFWDCWQEFVRLAGPAALDRQFAERLTAILKQPSLAARTNAELTELLRLWHTCLAACGRYWQGLAEVNTVATDKAGRELQQRCESGRQPDSLRAMYDIWTGAQEAAYMEAVFSSRYAQHFADMVNSLMQFRKQFNQLTQHSASLLQPDADQDD
ncbi:MAG: poly(R)-hydroxyalkanoic acid synthase subunit PhaE [Gammaproteobacteria bacterium]